MGVILRDVHPIALFVLALSKKFHPEKQAFTIKIKKKGVEYLAGADFFLLLHPASEETVAVKRWIWGMWEEKKANNLF